MSSGLESGTTSTWSFPWKPSTRIWLGALVVLAAGTLPLVTLGPAPAERGVVWSAGMEAGELSEWTEPGGRNAGGGEFNSSGGDARASRDVARTGDWSAALVLSEGFGGTRLFRWREPAEHVEAYYAAWFYFPQRYEPEVWWNIFQFKSALSESVNDPFWVLTVENRDDGAMYVALDESQTGRSVSQEVADLPVGVWVHLECYLRQSAMDEGRLTCWQDGQLLWDLVGITTHYAGSSNQWSVNNYSDAVAPAPVVIYVDDASITVPAWLEGSAPVEVESLHPG